MGIYVCILYVRFKRHMHLVYQLFFKFYLFSKFSYIVLCFAYFLMYICIYILTCMCVLFIGISIFFVIVLDL